jgi:methylated-DNA-[protein]-cysteine S-methyltransferase
MGLIGAGSVVERLYIGHTSSDEVRERSALELESGWAESDWWPELRQRIAAFAAGARDDFRDVEVIPVITTEFAGRVIAALRRVPYGETISYGELAQRAGAHRAARAVGSVMARNTTPLIVPCHRVLASGGKLGGFTCPAGVPLKRRLLEMEAHPGAAVMPRKSAGPVRLDRRRGASVPRR